MKDKTKIYIDLSKCSEEQRKHIFSLLPEPEKPDYYEVYNNYKYLQFIPASKFGNDRWMVDKQAFGKQELTYPEFIKLFEGGEGEKKCCDNPDIQWNKIEISIGDKQGSYKDLNYNFCNNCGETFNEAFD